MKKKSRRREFEKNNRVINIEQAREERRARLAEQKEKQQARGEGSAEISQGERRRARKVRINYARLLIFAAIVFLLVNFGISAVRIMQLRQEEQDALQYNEELTLKKEALMVQLENVVLPEYIESLAREDLKLVKANELLFVFPEEDLLKQPAASEDQKKAKAPDDGSKEE